MFVTVHKSNPAEGNSIVFEQSYLENQLFARQGVK